MTSAPAREQRARIAAGAERAVEIDAARAHAERVEAFGEQHGDMRRRSARSSLTAILLRERCVGNFGDYRRPADVARERAAAGAGSIAARKEVDMG